MSLRARPSVLWRAISRMVSTDSCLAVSMKEQVLTTRISASSGCAVRRAPARSSRPIITSESTRFLGQPREMKPTRGPKEAVFDSWGGAEEAAGGELLVTVLLYVGRKLRASERSEKSDGSERSGDASHHFTSFTHFTFFAQPFLCKSREPKLAVLAVEQVADRAAAGGIDLAFCFGVKDVGRVCRSRLGRFRFAAGGAAIGEAGLAGLQLEFLAANYARFDRERHRQIC